MRNKNSIRAFSLVEMLMALLVASLLLAALAPVMTKRMNDNVSITGISGGTRLDYKRTFYTDSEWTVPNGVNQINITAIGGGGSGGGASYGFKEITASESNWIVPDGVTKLRVFMTGAGGGGASGGAGKGVAYGTVSGASSSTTITTTGVSSWSIPSNVKGNVPALDIKCRNTPTNPPTKWDIVQDANSKAGASEPFLVKTASPGETLVKVEACGGGGGGGGADNNNLGGGGGASGGHVSYKVSLPSSFNSIGVTIGGGGGGGGYDDGTGLNGVAWGGGGGGSESLDSFANASQLPIAKGVYPGGNGGSTNINCKLLNESYSPNAPYVKSTNGTGAFSKTFNGVTLQAGLGAGSNPAGCTSNYKAGSGSLEGGGGGGGSGNASHGGGGGGATFFGRYANSTSNDVNFFLVAAGGGGGGTQVSHGGGGGGAGGGRGGSNTGGGESGLGGNFGTAGKQSTSGAGGASPMGVSYCAGGKGGNQMKVPGTSGQNGYMKISWGGSNHISCNYNQPSNGGGGGGAGQIWIGEIDVTPGQRINFNIGVGGNEQINPGSNGLDGGNTSIVVNGNTYSVSGGKGGKYEDDDTYVSNSGGLGGGIKTTDFDNKAKYINWTNTNIEGGKNGSQGNTVANGAGGGAGGVTYKKDGTMINGGASVGAQSNGADALSTNYGAGGGGGGGNYSDSFSTGGKGSNGYIYIEWGNANGGGGATGQVITKKNVWVSAGTKVKINIGKGGSISPILNTLNGINGYFGQDGNNGGDTYVTTTESEAIRAKGGYGGKCGRTDHGRGGNYYEVDNDGNPIVNGNGSGSGIGGSGSSGSNNQNYMMNSIKGEDGNDDYGGIGGSITESLCPLLEELNGLGGCGGNMPSGNCANSSSTPIGKNAAKIGGGGGGGAVKDNAAYPGGKGGDGMVVIEWNN